jgi:hypothetical protein
MGAKEKLWLFVLSLLRMSQNIYCSIALATLFNILIGTIDYGYSLICPLEPAALALQ